MYRWIQVRYKVHQTKEPAPRPRRTKLVRRSTRRSGYAFSHAQGYGDLVTSRRFLRRPPPARSTGFTPTGRSPGFKPTGRSAGYSPAGREQNPKQKVEPTSLQMFRAVKDSSFWCWNAGIFWKLRPPPYTMFTWFEHLGKISKLSCSYVHKSIRTH